MHTVLILHLADIIDLVEITVITGKSKEESFACMIKTMTNNQYRTGQLRNRVNPYIAPRLITIQSTVNNPGLY